MTQFTGLVTREFI